MRNAGQVVVVPPEVRDDNALSRRAAQISDILQATLLVCPTTEMKMLRQVAGTDVEVVQPDLERDGEVEFYAREPAAPPPEPYLAAPVELPILDGEQLATLLDEDLPTIAKHLRTTIGKSAQVRAMLFAPAWRNAAGTRVEMLVTGRTIWSGTVPTLQSGQLLVVHLPDLSPGLWLRKPHRAGQDTQAVAEIIARRMLPGAAELQRALQKQAFENLMRSTAKPTDAARAVALAALPQNAVVRLRSTKGGGQAPAARLTQFAGPARLLDWPMFQTVGGTRLTPRQLTALQQQSSGLIYGVIPEVRADLTGLDTECILSLNQEDERLVIGLFGEAAYVRVDRRDLLAEHRGVRCRDFASGLQSYPDFPLLVEGVDPTGWPAPEQRTCIEALLQQLTRRFLGQDPSQPHDPAKFPDWEENRRQACRHLQWFACHALSGGDPVPSHRAA